MPGIWSSQLLVCPPTTRWSTLYMGGRQPPHQNGLCDTPQEGPPIGWARYEPVFRPQSPHRGGHHSSSSRRPRPPHKDLGKMAVGSLPAVHPYAKGLPTRSGSTDRECCQIRNLVCYRAAWITGLVRQQTDGPPPPPCPLMLHFLYCWVSPSLCSCTCNCSPSSFPYLSTPSLPLLLILTLRAVIPPFLSPFPYINLFFFPLFLFSLLPFLSLLPLRGVICPT